MKTNIVVKSHFGTHFIMEDKKAHVFFIDHCEKCGKEVEAANGIGLVHSREELKGWGLIELSERLQELGYNENLQMCTCYDCEMQK